VHFSSPHTIHMPCPSHSLSSDHPKYFVNSTNHKAPHYVIISLLQLPLPRSPKYLPQHPIVEHPHPMSSLSCETPSSGPE
jgi:hypothetical protein